MASRAALLSILVVAFAAGEAIAYPAPEPDGTLDGTLSFVEGLGFSTIASVSLSGVPFRAPSPTTFTFTVFPILPTTTTTTSTARFEWPVYLSGTVSVPGAFGFGLAGTLLGGGFTGGSGVMVLTGAGSVVTPSLGVGGFPLQVLWLSSAATWTTSPFSARVAMGGPWRTSPVTITGMHLGGTPFSVQMTGFDSRTPGGLGMVQFVTPLVVKPLVAGQTVPVFGVFTVNLAPEPGRFVLLASGAAALLLLARRRRRIGLSGGMDA